MRLSRDHLRLVTSAVLGLVAVLGGGLAAAQDRTPEAAPGWHPRQATGLPDTAAAGDFPTAWAPETPDSGAEWLTVTFAEPLAPVAVVVHETFHPGALRRAVALTEAGEVELFRGKVPQKDGALRAIAVLPVTTVATATQIRLELATDEVEGWNEIDAVAVVDLSGTTHWAVHAEGSSFYRAEAGDAAPEAPRGPSPTGAATALDPLVALLASLRRGGLTREAEVLAAEILAAQAHHAGVPAAPPPPPTLAGLWETSFGRLRLRAEGDGLVGVYVQGGPATVRGRMDGDRFVFRYEEENARGEGFYRLKPGGAAFEGGWRPDGTEEYRPWTGTRASPPAEGERYLVVLEAPWESGLAEPETSFGDMVRALFEGTEGLTFRHRWFHDARDLRLWTAELALVDEPIVLVLATHATTEGLEATGGNIPAAAVAEMLAGVPSLRLVHLSACEAMAGKLPDLVFARRPAEDSLLGVSGYTVEVDWMASALTELVYLELVLRRDLSPEAAAAELVRLVRFAGDGGSSRDAIPAAHFRFRPRPAK